MKLSDRLEMVVSFVEPVKAAADVGTDHGYVPMELVRRGMAGKALAVDVKKGPLLKAEEHIRMAGLEAQIEARLSDGLLKLAPGEVEAVIIAGMGGELMIHILEQGRHMWGSVSQWVLSPHSEIHKVRRWLWENGFEIEREAMVFEDGKYYTALDVRPGSVPYRDAGGIKQIPEGVSPDFLYGRYLIGTGNPVLLRFLKEEEKKLMELSVRLSAMAEESEGARKNLSEVKQKLTMNREVQDEMQRNH